MKNIFIFGLLLILSACTDPSTGREIKKFIAQNQNSQKAFYSELKN